MAHGEFDADRVEALAELAVEFPQWLLATKVNVATTTNAHALAALAPQRTRRERGHDKVATRTISHAPYA